MSRRPSSPLSRPSGLTLALAVALVAACTGEPPAAPSAGTERQPLTAPSPLASPSGMAPSAPASALPSAAASPGGKLPSPALGGASASPSPVQQTEVGEANHGSLPFPSAPPVAGVIDLAAVKVKASSNDVVARGAVDGKPYTEWSARTGADQQPSYVFDLGKSQRVARLDVLADASTDAKVYYVVELSDDGTAWRPVGLGDADASNQRPVWGHAAWSAENARYVRFKPLTWGDSWVAVWEFRLSSGAPVTSSGGFSGF